MDSTTTTPPRQAPRKTTCVALSSSHGVSALTERDIRAAQTALRGALRDSLRGGINLGRLLHTAKSECRHGEWEPWLRNHFDGSARHAQRLMALAVAHPDPEALPAMSLSEALRALTGAQRKPKPALPRVNERLTPRGAKEALGVITPAIAAGDALAAMLADEHLPGTCALARAVATLRRAAKEVGQLLQSMAGDDDGGDTPANDDELAALSARCEALTARYGDLLEERAALLAQAGK